MSESSAAKPEISLEASIPQAGASLESILCTEELQRRPSRPPDYEKENCALVALVAALADSPSSIFQTLAKTILDITQCDSAGLSLLTRDGKTPDVCGQRFYWPAIAGMWNPHVGGGTPRNFGPCGDVLDQNHALLFRHFERRYPYLLPVIPAAEECLLVPFYVGGEAVGTIWGIMHTDRRKFDAEDDRVMASLGKFASSAYQAVLHIENLKFQVTEREKAEAEVRELAKGLEAKIRRLVDANVVGIVMWNLEGAITGANDAFLSMVQYDREDLAFGRVRSTDLTPAEWRGCDERAIAELKANRVFQPYQKEYFRKDGSRVPILLGGALFEESGNEGVAFILDLSEQKRTEKALRRSEERWRGVFENSTIGVALADMNGRFIAANSAYQSIVGYSEEELRSLTFLDLTHEAYRQMNLQQVEDLKAGTTTQFQTEKQYRRKDGSLRWVRNNVSLVPGSELIPQFFIGLVEDITEQKRAEEERERLRQAAADLAHLNRVSTMGELTASLAHEVNQPIGAAATNAQACLRFLNRDEPDVPEAREAALETVRDATRAASIIDRVRSLYRKGSSLQEMVDVNEVIREMVIMLTNEANRYSVTLWIELGDTLPKVIADRVQLQQVLMNLMLNGIEAMRDTGGELRIESRLAEDGQLMISVRDMGVGLPAGKADEIFDAFFTTKPQGTGLGLAITRSIIESHGGRVWAANSGQGATFHFTLPQKTAAHA